MTPPQSRETIGFEAAFHFAVVAELQPMAAVISLCEAPSASMSISRALCAQVCTTFARARVRRAGDPSGFTTVGAVFQRFYPTIRFAHASV